MSDDDSTQWNDSDVLKWRAEAARVPALLAKLDELRTTLDEVRGTVDVETRLLRKQVEQLREERNEQWGRRKDAERDCDNHREMYFAMIKRMGEVAMDLEGPWPAPLILVGKDPDKTMTAYVTQDMHREALGRAAQRIAYLERQLASVNNQASDIDRPPSR